MSTLSRATGTTKARHRNDFYRTIDARAVAALAPHVPAGTVFAEPCAGEGDLIALLEAAGYACDWAMELEPQGCCVRNRWPIGRGDALTLTRSDMGAAALFITNPPWQRTALHGLILHLAAIAPVWMLFDTGWKHTRQAAALGRLCTDIVSVGRLKWFADSEHDATDDCAWYRFDASAPAGPPRFHFRATAEAAQGMLL
jgi:hypothetical protein